MEKSFKFENVIFSFEAVKPNDTVPFSFKLGEGLTADDIEYVQAGCGCTDAYFDEETLSVVGHLDIAKAGVYNNLVNPVNKVVTVYFNDGQPRYAADSKKRMINNNKKKLQRLTIAGQVINEQADVSK